MLKKKETERLDILESNRINLERCSFRGISKHTSINSYTNTKRGIRVASHLRHLRSVEGKKERRRERIIGLLQSVSNLVFNLTFGVRTIRGTLGNKREQSTIIRSLF